MADFLKQNPYVSREEYMWEWTVVQIRLVSFDYTHVRYLTDEQVEKKKSVKCSSPDELGNLLGGLPTL